ncbi:MAG: IS256 family transposase [Gammaproteobacteria bacterium]|nr:IS256 family transposase [Gammaproteobacteria bacterium]
MTKNKIISFEKPAEFSDPIHDLIRDGARQLIQSAIETELQTLLDRYQDTTTPEGYAAVVRNGYLPERELQTGIGPVPIKVPKIRSRTGEAVTFRSALVPPYVRKTRSLEAALPWLYLKGVSTGEMSDALKVLVGESASGLSPSTVSKLKTKWTQEYATWQQRRLDKDRWVYLWADGIHSGLKGDEGRLCALVVIGVNERGHKHFLAIEDGVRESTQSWREVLLNLKSRGLNEAELAIGDGALGFWNALEEVYPKTQQQRCWVHKTANVLNKLPKSVQAKAKRDLHNIWQADTKDNARKAFETFIYTYQDKYPKATECLEKDHDELMTFYSFPAKHWSSIRTTNPIESSFATIRHRTKRTKGCLSRDGMLSMMFKLGQCAEKKWNRLRGFDYLAKVIQGVPFKDGIEQTTNRSNQTEAA